MREVDLKFGLDIGIASVGWAVTDLDNNIIDAGVRLFSEGGTTGTATERREKRASRRLIRRRKHRIERVRQLLFNYKIIDNIDYDFYTNEITPYELRVKGLREFLTKRELAIALLNLVKKRGIHNFDIKSSSKDSDEEKGTKDILIANDKKLGESFVCELQLQRLQNGEIDLSNGKVRGKKNVFRTVDYVKEAKAILLKQMENSSLGVDDRFIEKYISILEGRREYYTGPGKPSIYGWKDEEEWIENLFGRCTYFPEEIRMCKNSYTAELFNLLNDLNNLKIKREESEFLSKNEKEKLIELFKKQKPTLKRIADNLGVKEADIFGYRIDKSEKPLFTSLSTYKALNEIFGIEDGDLIDEISKILTIYQTNDKIIEKIEELGFSLSEEQIERLDKLSFTGSHSLSKKAMLLILDELLETNKNQMQLFTEKGVSPYKMDFTGKKTISKRYIDDWILSPVVKRSLTQAINVINALHKRYGIPSEVVIEMAREKNSDDKNNFLKKLQAENEKLNTRVKELLNGVNYKNQNGLFQKIKLWEEQNGECAYSGDKILIETLINRPELYEIDHIIPRSISFDDSQNNKVLVKREENQKKTNMTPFQYLSIDGRYDEFKQRMKANIHNRKKLENLLFEGELSKYAKNFIARNLVDTRYTTREILGLLKKYYSDNNYSVKVKAINGAVTNQIRKMWKFPKSRELSHSHHAQDALIILSAEKILNTLKNVKRFNDNEIIDFRTGEILTDEQYRELFKYEYGTRIKRYDRYKFSHFVDKKPNRQLSDETIYSTRLVKEIDKKGKVSVSEYIISKHTNIYSKDNKTIKKFFEDEKKQQQLLMYHNDKKTFDKFIQVFNEYKNSPNPFFAYYNEHKKFITKYCKKGEGVPIKSIKYRESQLGNCLDISHKYNPKNKKVVMLSILSLRADVYKKGDSYKFITVTYIMLEDKGKYYQLNEKKYNDAKERKGIDDNFEFLFSLSRGDIFEITKDKAIEKWKYKGVNNDKVNKFEVDFLDRFNTNYVDLIKELQTILKEKSSMTELEFKEIVNEKLGFLPVNENLITFISSYPVSSKQKFLTLGKDVTSIKKIYVDVLGNEYEGVENFSDRI